MSNNGTIICPVVTFSGDLRRMETGPLTLLWEAEDRFVYDAVFMLEVISERTVML